MKDLFGKAMYDFQTNNNPEGIPMTVFNEIRTNTATNRQQKPIPAHKYL